MRSRGRKCRAQVPHGAAGYYLLGRVCRLSNRQKQAAQFFAAALALDPLLWCAYEELCILGAPTTPEVQAESPKCAVWQQALLLALCLLCALHQST